MKLSALKKIAYSAPDIPNMEQSEPVRMTLRILYALVPSLFNLLGLGIALFYPIQPRSHRAILEAIQKRRFGETVQDPLRPERMLEGINSASR